MRRPRPRAIRGPALANTVLRAIRIHHWVKNILIFVPIVLAHKIKEAPLLLAALAGFFALSLAASSVYLANDFLDLETDRRHPRKKNRPLARGELPARAVYWLAPLLAALSLWIAAMLEPAFFRTLIFYLALAFGYCWLGKRVPLLDVMILSGLYTIRVLAGGAVTGIPISAWTLAYCVFVFLSLGFLKRYSEMRVQREENGGGATGRAYRAGDLEFLAIFGAASGYVAALVLALYIHSPEIHALYQRPEWVWLLCILHIYWISWVWLVAHRGQMPDDPILFALRDKTSYVVAAAGVIVLAIAS